MDYNGTGDGVGSSSSDYPSTSNPGSQMIGVESYHDLGYDPDNYWVEMYLIDGLTSPQRQSDGQASGMTTIRMPWQASFDNLPRGESSESMSLRPSDPANCVDPHPNQQPTPRSHGDPQGINRYYMPSNLEHPQYSLNVTAPGGDSFAEPYQPTGESCREKQQPICVPGAKRPAQSLYPGPRQFPGEQPYVNQVQSSRPTYDTRGDYNPLDSGGPHDNGNHVAATTGIQEPDHCNQHSSRVQRISMVEPSARKDKPFTFHESYDEGSSQGKQPQHNGKDHGSGRPGPGISHTVGKTCTKPVRRTPEKSARRGGKKQCGHIDADKAARIRGINWMVIETLYLLFKKKEFSETPGESWSVRASEFLKSQGFHRTSVSCQQRWDTMKKHYDKRDQFRIDEGYVPAGFYDQSLLYDLMRIIMEGHGEQQSPSGDTQGSGQLEGALAPSSAIHTDPIEFSNANGPSLPPDASIDDAYASGQVYTNPRIEFPNAIGLSLPPGVPTNDAYASGQTPTFKDWASNPSMQTRTGVHQKQQSLQNDTSRGGQMVDASAQLSQGTQEPKVSSHDPHMIEMALAIVRPLLQEMEEKMKSSHDASMAAISAVRQEVKTMLESYMNGKN